jgi:hypothetical protein
MMKWLEAYLKKRAASIAETELNKLSDRHLRDLGIYRHQIPEVVREGICYSVSFSKVGPSKVGPSKVGPSKVGPSKVGPSKVGPSKVTFNIRNMLISYP